MNKPKKGPCEMCPANARRPGRRWTTPAIICGGEQYVLCNEHLATRRAQFAASRAGSKSFKRSMRATNAAARKSR